MVFVCYFKLCVGKFCIICSENGKMKEKKIYECKDILNYIYEF